MRFLLTVAAAWMVATLAVAQAQSLPPPSGSTPPDTVPPAQIVPSNDALPAPPERRWRLGAALGYGQRSNPLIQSRDIPVVVDLDIAYFGNKWFFDNGDLGLEVLDNALFTTNLVARVNSDQAFFSKTNTRYVTYSVMAGGLTASINNPQTGAPISTQEAQPLKPPDRSYAIEAGLETLFSGDWGQATLRAFHDASGTHDGYEVTADYSYRLTRGRLSLSPSVGVSWKSAALSDYYWGVHADETSITLAPYEAKAGLGWQAGLRMNYYLSKRMRIALSANYERLQHSVAQSPLVERNYVFGHFAGIAWQF
jgi:MipA family protein